MSNVRSLHQSASECSVFAMMAMAKGKPEEARLFYQKAFELEKEAATRNQSEFDDELWRYVLLRSAAALAYKSGNFEEAEGLIASTMTQDPPAFIVQELKDIQNLIKKARRHQKSNGSVQIKGKVTAANGQEITVVEADSSHPFSIVVPAEKIKEIVRDFFLENVTVQATSGGQGILLKNIAKAA